MSSNSGATTTGQAVVAQAPKAMVRETQHGGGFARVWVIARNTFREAVRDRVLYNLVVFVLLLIVGAIFLGSLSFAQETKILADAGLGAMLLFGAFLATFIGTGLVYKEIERRTVYAIFAKPVGRGEFIVGKYLGLCLTLAVNVAVMGAGLSLALLYVRGGYDPLALRIWPTIGLIYIELTILVAVALLFSTFSSPALSALLTLALFVIGHFNTDLRLFAAATGTPAARLCFAALSYLLPNLSQYSAITSAAYGAVPTATTLAFALLYGMLYSGVLLAAATLIFSRRDFK